MSNVKRCFDLLKENDKKVYNEVRDVLSRLCKNVMKNPNETKYRKVRLSNPIVVDKILPAVGAMECLFEIGFVERDDHLLLPETASLSNLQELERLLSEPGQTKEPQTKPPAQKSCAAIHPTSPALAVSSSFNLQTNVAPTAQEEKFFQQIRGQFQEVLKYENTELQNKARALIPLSELQINAMEKMRLIQRGVKSTRDNKQLEDISIEDLVFVEVLAWFKEKFFNWVDSPECNKCSGKCSFQKVIPARGPGVSRIEIHRCTTCANTVEFPRYSDPALLLYTRKGRCGEWANAFALICRSLNYDTRLVWDYTDHVWVEVWSVAANRWIHADPCENVLDRPLMYEKGWGKKLSYILAFSKDEMQDVTWRYTSDQKAVLKRRKLCSESNLVSIITSLSENRRRTSCSIPRQQYLIRRSLMELVELIIYHFGNNRKDESDKDYHGRTSGSLAWRLSRQEAKIDSNSSHVWRIPSEVESIKLSYTASSDNYVLVDRSGNVLEKIEGWAKGVYEMNGGIFRKVENDWKMVYLARSPENQSGNISWNFEISDSKLEISNLSLRAIAAVFHGASIEWKIQGFYRNGQTKVVPINDSKEFKTEQLNGTFKISLSATLSGGEKDLAWQHAQLFRQSLDSTDHSIEICINTVKVI
ncbi:peptide-N(4)-(N-acetyl-beta-glucosaminyl)asparagine amidase [Neodiprion pinetum]|uniref:peptide-N(4)-(N-acetyl-beta- glucosaminyl)asparagine amidase n=1 Tax=Neodiprion pinetum TaxID=441929 RepID=UPI001EDE534E|nr:peptide-N(4)-(N-acetyl-beta-glucosaminyl)asparagine amidase [Neodiprion pinetum]